MSRASKSLRSVFFLGGAVLLILAAQDTFLYSDDGDEAVRTERLTSRIDYWYAGHLGIVDDEGRKLVWEATIEGDITGTMKWWFGPKPAPNVVYVGGRVGYYAGRWEIWDGETLLLAGESAGKTVTPEGANGMWDGHGVVTEASGRFNRLKGCHIYETGPVINEGPPNIYGTGIFLVH